MPSARALYAAFATVLGRSLASVEAYGLALRKAGAMEPTKRGRGAKPATADEAGALLLAILIGETTNRDPSFEHYSALRLDLASLARSAALRERLRLEPGATFLHYLQALARLFADDRAHELIAEAPEGKRHLSDYDEEGPGIHVRIKGPRPGAVIQFAAADPSIETLPGLVYLDFTFPHLAICAGLFESGEDKTAEKVAAQLRALNDATARGVRYERMIGGREFSAVRDAFAIEKEASET